jgi:hypothetical protein
MRNLACLTVGWLLAGCGGGGSEATGDSGGPDGAAEGGSRDTGTPTGCSGEPDCDNGMFCDGVEQCIDGACAAGTPRGVDDGVACTDDRCDEATDTVENEPNDARCEGGMACDADGNLVALTGRCDPFIDCEADPTPIMMCTATGPTCDRAMLTTCSPTCDPVAGCGEDCTTAPCMAGADRCEGAVHVSTSPGCSADGTMCQDTEARVDCAAMNMTFCRSRDLVTRTCTCDARGGCRCSETMVTCFLTGCCPLDPRGPMCCPRIG